MSSIGRVSALTPITSGQTSTLMTFIGGPTTPGSTIVVFTYGIHTSGYDGAVEDGVNNTPTTAYERFVTSTFANGRLMVSHRENSLALNDTRQHHFNGTGNTGFCFAVEILTPGTPVFDAQIQGTGNTAATNAAVSLAVGVANSIVFAATGIKNASAALALSLAGFTNLVNNQDGTVAGFSVDYVERTSSGTQNANYSHANSAGDWGALAISFKIVPATVPTVTDCGDEVHRIGEVGVVVTGTNFGTSQGTGLVKICPSDDYADANGVAQTITAWTTGTTVTFNVVGSANLPRNTTLYLFVQNDAGSHNASGYPIQLTHSAGVLASGVLLN